MKLQLTKLSPLVFEVRGTYSTNQSFDFLLFSDLHYDNPKCNRNFVHRLLDEAKVRGAGILFNGDTLCLMQARGDKRGSKSDVRPEHQGSNYFDLVIKDTAERFAPYADNIILLADGNHETAVRKHKEIDPLDYLKLHLSDNIMRAGYHGFVRFVFEHESGGAVRSMLMYFHHGKYGGIVSKGVQGVSRYATAIPQADVVWSGHTHDLWHVPQPRLMVSAGGNVYTDQADHVKTGTAKDEFNVPGGFGVERLAKPAAIGAYWMTLKVAHGKIHRSFSLARP